MKKNISTFKLLLTAISSLIISGTSMSTAWAEDSTKPKDTRFANQCYIHGELGYSMQFDRLFSSHHGKRSHGTEYGGIGYGFKINNQFRTDITLSYRRNYKYGVLNNDDTTEHQRISNTSFMFNGYFSPKIFDNFEPYVVCGIGVAVNNVGNLIVEGKGNFVGAQKKDLAWQIGIGTLYRITNTIYADITYKYVNLGQVATKDLYTTDQTVFRKMSAVKGTLRVHEISLGFNYNL